MLGIAQHGARQRDCFAAYVVCRFTPLVTSFPVSTRRLIVSVHSFFGIERAARMSSARVPGCFSTWATIRAPAASICSALRRTRAPADFRRPSKAARTFGPTFAGVDRGGLDRRDEATGARRTSATASSAERRTTSSRLATNVSTSLRMAGSRELTSPCSHGPETVVKVVEEEPPSVPPTTQEPERRSLPSRSRELRSSGR
jgi:hypothetical protein